ncbi:hypothetical protein [Cetobacterium sp.]|uniref:hypothetical protein n=1 Tax=Cetobacterium sp. TaxID=2071632 RepID=UPI003F374FE5
MKIKQNISLDENLSKAIKILAEENNTTVSSIITNLLVNYKNQPQNKEILYRYQLKKWNYASYIELVGKEILENIRNSGYQEAHLFLKKNESDTNSIPLIELKELLSNYLSIETEENKNIYSDIYEYIKKIARDRFFFNLNNF